MKSEHRHELETNVLAKNLAEWGEKLRPYASTLLTVVAVLAAAYVLLSMWRGVGAQRDRDAWDQYEMAVLGGARGELDQLQRVAASEDYAGSAMQEWAFAAWADRQLWIAAERYLIDRDDANKRLTNIAGVYEELASSAGEPEVRNRARMGLARISEMQNRLDDARKQYGLVEGSLAPLAAERIKALESKEAQDVCEWLATADLPKPRPAAGPGTPGARPGFDAEPPAVDASPMGGAGQSLEDILGGLTGELEPGRYGETPAGTDAAQPPAEQGATDGAGPAQATQPAGTSAATPAEPAQEPVAEENSSEEGTAPTEQPARQ
jgi:hypothetical protein